MKGAACGGEEKKKKGYLGTPQTPAKGSPPFAIPLEKPYVRTYGLAAPCIPAFQMKGNAVLEAV
ncbi:hypothetical protein KDI_40160 [Dictyobacter arantiisoli]|uniref:Uncharacterized protein n=1 Tax=Dictyobacter arantiisoli TaxID=2014874 RepID=A0A5A5TGJ8_9CHLR|nr:hypothetical protein KDI_40160 [Dictyobacter arantiisoli]